MQVHFLDVGAREYGDAVLCQIGTRSVLIDGSHPGDQVGSPGHPSIPDQLKRLLKAKTLPVTVDLEAKALQTYERFQAALLRKTGSPFRYLPIEPRAVPTQAPPAPEPSVAAATREKSALVGEFSIGVDFD